MYDEEQPHACYPFDAALHPALALFNAEETCFAEKRARIEHMLHAGIVYSEWYCAPVAVLAHAVGLKNGNED